MNRKNQIVLLELKTVKSNKIFTNDYKIEYKLDT